MVKKNNFHVWIRTWTPICVSKSTRPKMLNILYVPKSPSSLNVELWRHFIPLVAVWLQCSTGAYDLTKRSPFALPVCTTNGSSNVSRRRSYRQAMGTSPTPSTPTATLSGRPLGSRLCATASQSVIQTCRTPVFDDAVAATAAIQLEQQQSSHNSSRSSSGMEEEKQITVRRVDFHLFKK
jgi:hypothetical protein